MIYGWKMGLWRLSLAIAATLIIGLMLGVGAWLAFAVALFYCYYNLRQLRDLIAWLRKSKHEEPPEAPGLWGTALDNIYRLQREERETQAVLSATIDYLESCFSSLKDAVVMLDASGHIEWSNLAAQRLLGLRHPEDHSRLLVNLLRDPDFIRWFDGANNAEPLRIASPVRSQVWVEMQSTRFGKQNTLLFARDVTRNVQLEDMRQDFLANVSHELRTPLTVISGYLDMLVDMDMPDKRWQRPVEQMSVQSKRMEALISDLMLLSRLESVPEPSAWERISMRPLLDMLAEEVQVAAKGERRVEIDCRAEDELLACSKEVHSAFSNLAINAAKYTEEGDRIVLRWYRRGDKLCFEVEDSGEGIEPQHLPRLTERFYRVDKSRSVETGGTGLGLAIVKHSLMRHQAELEIHSTPGLGSRFTCIFPG